MNKLILNRQGLLPADSWYQIEVTGEHYNPAAGLVQVIDAPALESIVNRFATAAASPNFAGLLIDQDHFSLDPAKSTEAFGWVKELRNREGQLEGRIEWSDLGKPAVESGRFKFFSTVYAAADVEKLGERTVKNRAVPAVRPLALDRLAVTNDPNNKGGKPISNRAPGTTPEAGKPEEQNQPDMKNLKELLGLPADATEDQIYAAVEALKAPAAELPEIKNRLKDATTELATLRDAQIEADLEAHAAHITNREAVKAVLVANRAAGLAMLAGLKLAAPAAAPERLTNRATAKTPAELGTEQATKADDALAAKIRNRATEIERSERIPFKRAFAKAEREFAA